MISWFQTVIQRHHKILFSLLLVIIIIAFVFTIGSFGGIGPGPDEMGRKQEFYGFNLNDQRTAQQLGTWTFISADLNNTRFQTQEQQTNAILQRALGLHLADQLQIPTPNEAQFARFVQGVPGFADPATGIFSASRMQQIIDQAKSNPQLGEAMLTLVLIQDYRIDKVLRLLGGPGYVPAEFAASFIRNSQAEWTLESATLSRSAFAPQTDLSEEALVTYYEANKERYKPEDKIVAGYVLFPASTFEAEVPAPSEAQLQDYYNRHLAQWPKAEDGQTKPFADVRDAVAALWKTEHVNERAATAANKLAIALHNAANTGKLSQTTDSIAAHLKESGLSLTELPAFNAASASDSANATATAVRQRALGLKNQERFFSDAILTTEGAAIAFILGEEKAEVPALADIRVQVLTDYTAEQSAAQFAAKLQSDREVIAKAIAEGKSFEEAAKSLGLSVKKVGPFTLQNLPEGFNQYFIFAVMDLPTGGLSEPLTDALGSTFVYVADKTEPQIDLGSEEVKQTMTQVQPMFSRETTTSTLINLVQASGLRLEQGE